MAIEINIPSAGESVTEATIVRWLKQDGDTVHIDDPILELETDKATGELAAPASGKLVILIPEGKTVAIGTVVGRIEEAVTAKRESKKVEHRPAAKVSAGDKEDRNQREAVAMDRDSRRSSKSEVALSPAARRLAREGDIDVSALKGTGPRGRITKEDVLAQMKQARPPDGSETTDETEASVQPELEVSPAPPTSPPAGARHANE